MQLGWERHGGCWLVLSRCERSRRVHSIIVMGGISHTERGPGAVVDGSEENGTAFSLQQFLRGSDASLLKILDGIWSSRCHKSGYGQRSLLFVAWLQNQVRVGNGSLAGFIDVLCSNGIDESVLSCPFVHSPEAKGEAGRGWVWPCWVSVFQ